MGHTNLPMRWVIYDKMDQMKKLSHGLREPEKTIAEDLLNYVFQAISAINYANPLPDEIENDMLFSILLQEKIKYGAKINDFTLFIFSLMILYKENKIKNPNESDIYRLLRKR